MTIDHGGERDRLAPVIPLFAGSSVEAPESPTPEPSAAASSAPAWHTSWTGDDPWQQESTPSSELAEAQLLRRLRARSLSVAEARAHLTGLALDDQTVEALIARFRHIGYLDDVALAEQLVRSGVQRKGQGRRTIALTLAKRGIASEVAEAALEALADDDGERALAFARSKAASFARLDRELAVRRLGAQLVRRGYGTAIALRAVSRALDEMAGRSTD